MYVSRGETKNPEPRVDKEVLTAIVFDQSLSMTGSVVLDDKTRGRVEEVSSTQEPTGGIAKFGLHLWLRQAGLQ